MIKLKFLYPSSYGQMHRLLALAICAAMNPMKVLYFPISTWYRSIRINETVILESMG